MLPPRNEVLLFCRPTAQQRQVYEQFTAKYRIGNSSSLGTTSDALTTLTSLRKICAHPQLVEENDQMLQVSEDTLKLSGKLNFLDSLLTAIREKSPDDKIVIVSNYTSALTLIENAILKPKGLTYCRLDGSTELSNRQALVDTFNRTSSERNFAFLLSSKAGGCGLNLIGGMSLK